MLQALHPGGYRAFDIVVIAASAGGIVALRAFLSGLPACFPAPVIIAQHLSSRTTYESRLNLVLGRDTALQVKWATDGENPAPGNIYLAPQDQITSIDPGTGLLRTVTGCGPRRSTPVANTLFESAARFHGSRTLALVLSGVLRDGAEGAALVAGAGGRVVVQSCNSAEFDSMPKAAMMHVPIALSFDPRALAHVVVTLVMAPGASEWFRVAHGRTPFDEW